MRFRPAIAAMIAVLVGCGVLGVVGLGVEDKLDPLSLTIDGTGVGPRGRPRQRALRRRHPVRGPAHRAAGGDRTAGPAAGPGPAPHAEGDRDLALGPGHGRRPAPGRRPGADHRRLPRPPGDGDARHGPGARTTLVEEEVQAAPDRHPVRLRLRLPRPAGRNDPRHRARRAARRAAAPDRPPDRLPLAGRRRDPARSSAPSRCSPAAASSSCSAR